LGGRLSVDKHLCFNPPTSVGGSLVHDIIFSTKYYYSERMTYYI